MAAHAVLASIYPSLKKYLDRVAERYEIKQAYVFGSYVRNEATQDSDIDLAVVSPSLSGDRFKDNVELGVLTWGIDTRIEPIGYRPEHFNDDVMLPSEIMKTGILIFPDPPDVAEESPNK